ncbi:unnamed protein product [Effrenium voratum]|nr:unnamed protein product [Effrenium voratum]CAJ1451160.1 unnamed protein product [Effrenium voratum]
MKPEHEIWSLIGEVLWDVLRFLDDKALLDFGACRYLLLRCERARLQIFLQQVSPEKRSSGRLRLSDDGHVSRRLCPPRRRLVPKNTRATQSALSKLACAARGPDQLVLGSILPWVECGDQSTRAAAVRAVGRVAVRGDRGAVGVLLRCMKESSLGSAAMFELGLALQRLVRPGDPDIVRQVLRLLESEAFAQRHAALQALPHVVLKGDKLAIEKVVARVDDKDVEIREEAIRALGKVAEGDDHGALNCIIRGLRDESIYVRRAALEVMP